MICYYCGESIPDDELVYDAKQQPMHEDCRAEDENKWRGFVQPAPWEIGRRVA